jgi:hypothetical protein
VSRSEHLEVLRVVRGGGDVRVLGSRRNVSREHAVAFLASMAARPVVMLFGPGLTRIGRDGPFGDFERCDELGPRHAVVVIDDRSALIAGDRGRKPELLIPAALETDARTATEALETLAERDGIGALDFFGNEVFAVEDGDVYRTGRAAWVFGWLEAAR